VKAIVRTELIGGPHDGAFLESDHYIYDFPIPPPIQLTPPSDDELMRPPRMKVHRYRRTERTKMLYEGVFTR
jgi:hypothetical protein